MEPSTVSGSGGVRGSASKASSLRRIAIDSGSNTSSSSGLKVTGKRKRKKYTGIVAAQKSLRYHRMLQDTRAPFLQDKACKMFICDLEKCLECRQDEPRRGGKGGVGYKICRFLSFRNIRYTEQDNLIVVGFPDCSTQNDYIEDDSKIWRHDSGPSTGMSFELAKYLVQQVGYKFCEFITQEKESLTQLKDQTHKMITWKRVVPDLREMCDVCSTSLFNYHWVCGKCGFSACLSCFNTRKSGKSNYLYPYSRKAPEWAKTRNESKDRFGWLTCGSEPHKLDLLMLTQIIPGENMINLWMKMHELCKCLEISIECDCKEFNARTFTMKVEGIKVFPKQLMTLRRTIRLFPTLPHSWLCSGYLLNLIDPLNPGNLEMFQPQWRSGLPVLISNVVTNMDRDLWTPESFSRDFGNKIVTLVNCVDGSTVSRQKMKAFWDGFENVEERLQNPQGEPMLLKLKDWPPKDDFANLLPNRFKDLMNALPMKEYTRENGIFNLVARVPRVFCKPDLGPKLYVAYGSALGMDKSTTNLHLDASDAVNVLVYVGKVRDNDNKDNTTAHDEAVMKAIEDSGCDHVMIGRIKNENKKPGALWHIWDAADVDKIRALKNRITLERGLSVEPNHDPIHDQSLYIDKVLRKRLKMEYNVVGYSIIQCEGDAVFIPAGAPHQVRNLNNCIKVAEDFVSPENVGHCFRLTEEFRHLTDWHSNHEDLLQIKNLVYHTVKDAVAVLDATPLSSKKRARVEKELNGQANHPDGDEPTVELTLDMTDSKLKRKKTDGLAKLNRSDDARVTGATQGRKSQPGIYLDKTRATPRYCLCNEVSYGSMILCDNEDCPIKWFHFKCVGIYWSPKGQWFCPKCIAFASKRNRKKNG